MTRALLSAVLLLVGLAGAPVVEEPVVEENGQGDAQASERYPCARASAVVRFFTLDTDAPELAPATEALRELGAELVYGPRTTDARPGHAFVALRAPSAAAPKKLAQALKKAGAAAHELECVAFDGRTNNDSNVNLGGFSLSSRDFVMGLSGDIAWFDSLGPWTQFYGPPGKLEGREIAERFEKLYAPYGGGRLGEVVRERFTWTLLSAPDAKVAARLEKAIAKQAGVVSAHFAEKTLEIVVALEGLAAAADVGPIPSAQGEVFDPAGRAAPRAAWSTLPLYELLVAESLVAP